MKIPRQVYIRGNLWKIKYRKKVFDDKGNACFGLTVPDSKEILIEKGLSQEKTEWTFWHEYGHAMLDEACAGSNHGHMSWKTEETICINFADVMMADKEIKFKRRKQK